MTGLTAFLLTIWLSFTGLSITPDPLLDTGSIEYQMNYRAEQKDVITEDFFTFAAAIWRYNYARGCAGWYEWSKCWTKSFDCAGVIKAYWFIKGILTHDEIGENNSKWLYDRAISISPYIAERGDYTYWELISGTGLWATHWAFVSEWLSWNRLTIFDGLWWRFKERELRLWCTPDYCYYNTARWKYKISFSTNPLFEIAQEKWIEVKPFAVSWTLEQSTGTQYEVCEFDEKNPLGFSVTISWFDYDSIANRIASYRYDNGGSVYMIAKFMAESHFNTNAKGKLGERWLCQLMPNKTNNVRIKNPQRKEGREFQAKICLEKWEAVPDPEIIWFADAHSEIHHITVLKE